MNNIEVITNVLLIDSFNTEAASKSNIKSRGGLRTCHSRAYTCTEARVKPAAQDDACSHAILLARRFTDNSLVSENAMHVKTMIRVVKFHAIHYWLHRQLAKLSFLAHFSSRENRFSCFKYNDEKIK